MCKSKNMGAYLSPSFSFSSAAAASRSRNCKISSMQWSTRAARTTLPWALVMNGCYIHNDIAQQSITQRGSTKVYGDKQRNVDRTHTRRLRTCNSWVAVGRLTGSFSKHALMNELKSLDDADGFGSVGGSDFRILDIAFTYV